LSPGNLRAIQNLSEGEKMEVMNDHFGFKNGFCYSQIICLEKLAFLTSFDL